MNKEILIKRVTDIENSIEKLRTDLLNEDLETGKGKKQKKNIAQVLDFSVYKDNLASENTSQEDNETYAFVLSALRDRNFPTDNDFIKDICKVIKRKNIAKGQLIETFDKVAVVNKKGKIEDITKYIFGSLNKINEN